MRMLKLNVTVRFQQAGFVDYPNWKYVSVRIKRVSFSIFLFSFHFYLIFTGKNSITVYNNILFLLAIFGTSLLSVN